MTSLALVLLLAFVMQRHKAFILALVTMMLKLMMMLVPDLKFNSLQTRPCMGACKGGYSLQSFYPLIGNVILSTQLLPAFTNFIMLK